jgi:hypothetical protein
MSRTVAVYGLNGVLGIHIINALLSEPFISKIKIPIRLITSSDKRIVDSDKVEYVKVSDSADLKKAFEGIDVVINSNNFPNSVAPELIDALVANKVKLYIPSQFGTDLTTAGKDFPGFLDFKDSHSKAARDAGIKTVDIYTGLFHPADEKFFGSKFQVLNFDPDKKEVDIIGGESTLINPSFLPDVGKVVAALVTKDDHASIPDSIRTYSDRVTLGDLVAHYERVNSTTLTKKYIDPQELIAEAKKKFENFSFDDFLLYLQAFIAGGEGKGIIFEQNNDREFINPGESLFKWTKYVI